jgi:hypothetical protein
MTLRAVVESRHKISNVFSCFYFLNFQLGNSPGEVDLTKKGKQISFSSFFLFPWPSSLMSSSVLHHKEVALHSTLIDDEVLRTSKASSRTYIERITV